MSTVTHVPETVGLDGSDAPETARRTGYGKLFSNAFIRLRYADGFSFARSLAFQVVLAVIPGIIFIVALAARLGEGQLRSIVAAVIESLTPKPAAEMFLQVFQQGAAAGSGGNLTAIIVGGVAMLVGAVTAMAQLQRGASRIYGVDSDRPTFERYGLATVLTLTAGTLIGVAFVLTAIGAGLNPYFEDELLAVWRWVRWPLGLAILPIAFGFLFKAAPNRRQPTVSWLAVGGAVAVILWFAVSVLLAFYLNASGSFGDTYGPLAGVIGFMLWAQLSAIAIFYGLAVAAELEAARAGVCEPRQDESVDGAREVVPA